MAPGSVRLITYGEVCPLQKDFKQKKLAMMQKNGRKKHKSFHKERRNEGNFSSAVDLNGSF